MTDYKLKPGKLGEKLVGAYKDIERKFVETCLEEDGSMKTGGMGKTVTNAYQTLEDTVVGGYKKVENAFVSAFLEETKSEKNTEDAEASDVQL